MRQSGTVGFDYRPQNSQSHSPVTHEPNMDSGDTRKANYQQFSGLKFKEDLGQSVDLLLRDYEACPHQHRLTPTQKKEYFMNLLEGPAHSSLLDNYAQGLA